MGNIGTGQVLGGDGGDGGDGGKPPEGSDEAIKALKTQFGLIKRIHDKVQSGSIDVKARMSKYAGNKYMLTFPQMLFNVTHFLYGVWVYEVEMVGGAECRFVIPAEYTNTLVLFA